MANVSSLTAEAYMSHQQAENFVQTLLRHGKCEIGDTNFRLVINLKRDAAAIKIEAATPEEQLSEQTSEQLSDSSRYTETAPGNLSYWESVGFQIKIYKQKK